MHTGVPYFSFLCSLVKLTVTSTLLAVKQHMFQERLFQNEVGLCKMVSEAKPRVFPFLKKIIEIGFPRVQL